MRRRSALVMSAPEMSANAAAIEAGFRTSEHAAEPLKGKVGPHGVHMSTPGVLTKGGTDRQAAQLATRRPDLAEAVRSGLG
jgi:hypothetical protein